MALGTNIAFERVLMNMGIEDRILIPSFADLQPAWNRGVSFRLLTQDSATGSLLLMAFLVVMIVAVVFMMWRAAGTMAAVAFGLILGGALGNLLDRATSRPIGAVFDFLALRLGTVPLFVNLADIFISAGVVLLFLDLLLRQPPNATDFAA